MRKAKVEIIIGQQYNNLKVLAMLDKKSANGQHFYHCRCICGNEREVIKNSIGKIAGCGCTRKAYRKGSPLLRSKPTQTVTKNTTATQAIATPSQVKAKTNLDITDFDVEPTEQPTLATPSQPKRTMRRLLENKLDALKLAREERALERELDQLLKGC